MHIRARSLVALVPLVLACAVPSMAWAAGPNVSNQDLALSATVTVPIPNSTETVNLAGVIHSLTWQSSPNAQGSCRLRFHANAAGVSGIGTTTGLQYLLVGASDIAFPPDPCSQPTAPMILTFTLLPTTSNNLFPPNPCDVTFVVSFDENGQIIVSIQLVEVPTDN